MPETDKMPSAMRILYSLLCDTASMRDDGRLDLEGVFHELHAKGFPAQQDRLTLVSALQWKKEEEGNQEFEIILEAPNGQLLFRVEVESQVEFQDPQGVPPQTRLLLPLDNVVFPTPGRFEFILKRGQEEHKLAQLYLVEIAEDRGDWHGPAASDIRDKSQT